MKSDLTGRTFGRLTVLYATGESKWSQQVWTCLCACGKQTEVVTGDLTCSSNNTRSCGCLRNEQLAARRRKRPFEHLYNLLVKRNEGLGVPLTYEEFLLFTEMQECSYCGALLKWNPFNNVKGGRAYNLDRKDPRGGYTADNVVTCCFRCNRGKGNLFTFEEWTVMTKALREANYARATN